MAKKTKRGVAVPKLGVADFLFELGMLKNLPRSGWQTIGIKQCESVADHSFRTAAIAYVLAKMENLPAEKTEMVLAAALFHDLAETRTGDFNLLNKQYCKADNDRAFSDALSPAGEKLSFAIKRSASDKIAAAIVHEADKLELVLQALEYVEKGNPKAKSWAENAGKRIKTASGKKLLNSILRTPAYRWLFEMRKGKA